VAQRVAAYRERQRQSGLVPLSLMVPAEDVRWFQEMASGARDRSSKLAAVAPGNPAEPRLLSSAGLRLAQQWSARSGLKLRLNKPGLTLADLLARNLAQEIARAGWPVGRNLGTEAEFMARYGVGRGLLRQAIRLLEYQSVAIMQRGANGGLVVAEPQLEGVAYAAGVYLQARHFSVPDLISARSALELHILERCAHRLNEEARRRLQRLLAVEAGFGASASVPDLQRFHLLLASIAGNPASHMFLDTLLRASRFYSAYYRYRPSERARHVAMTVQAHASIARALFAGDIGRAGQEMRRYLQQLAGSLSEPRAGHNPEG